MVVVVGGGGGGGTAKTQGLMPQNETLVAYSNRSLDINISSHSLSILWYIECALGPPTEWLCHWLNAV